MENTCHDEYTSLSFSTYSSNKLWEIAVKVAAEKKTEHNDDEDFEFSLVREDEEFAHHGEFRSFFPVFNRDLLRSDGGGEIGAIKTRISVPLDKLLFGDREDQDHGSCSSSEAEELENIPAGSYCVWRPKAADQSRCKKSRSAGSASKRWKFSDLLRRSNSEGKDSLVFLTPKNREEKEVAKKGKWKARSAHEALYVRNRKAMEGDKKKSFLPYRQDLVGFFVKTSPHFYF